MKRAGLFLMLIVVLLSCQKKIVDLENHNAFAKQFKTLQLKDSLHLKHWEWNESSNNQFTKGNAFDAAIFYNALDTSQLTNKYWLEKFYAIGKISWDENRIAYLMRNQLEDVPWEQHTHFILYNTATNKVEQEFIIADFLGYEGYIQETKGVIISKENGLPHRILTERTEERFSPEGDSKQNTTLTSYTWENNTFTVEISEE